MLAFFNMFDQNIALRTRSEYWHTFDLIIYLTFFIEFTTRENGIKIVSIVT
jgi:hypothetical protein